jgi:hypothetical protein
MTRRPEYPTVGVIVRPDHRRTTITGGLCVAVIIALNALLLCQQFCHS